MKINLFLISVFIFILSLSLVSAVGTYPAVDPNMVLYYHFNNDSSVGENYSGNNYTIYDYSGSGNNGTANNTIFQPNTGILNDGSMYFNGVNSSIDLKKTNINNTLSMNNNFTVSMWINPKNNLDSFLLSSTNTTNDRFSLWYSHNKYIVAEFYNGIGFVNISISTVYLPLNNWYYVVFVHNTFFNAIYINGVNATLNWTDVLSPATSSPRIGSSTSQASFFNGSIDEVIIYNKSLSYSDVWYNYFSYIDCFNLSTNLNYYGNANLCVGNYFINSSINFLVNNLNFNGMGSNIYFNIDNKTNKYGFFSSGSNNSIIQNLSLIELNNQTSSDAIHFSYSDNLTIKNIFIWTDNVNSIYPIYTSYCNNLTIFNNVINVTNALRYVYNIFGQHNIFTNISNNNLNVGCKNCQDVYLPYSTNSSIYYNTMFASGNQSYNIYIPYTDGTNIFYNNLTNVNYGGWMIHPENHAINFNIYKNNLYYYGVQGAAIFIELNSTGVIDSNYIYSNSTSGQAIGLQGSSKNNIIKNNLIIMPDGQDALFAYDDTACNSSCGDWSGDNNNSFINNTVYFNSSTYTKAILLGNNYSLNNSFINNTIYSNVNVFQLQGTSGNSFQGNILIHPSNYFDYVLLSSNNNIIDDLITSAYIFNSSNNLFKGLFNALFLNSNNSASINSGDINISLNPNEWVYVFDNWNCNIDTSVLLNTFSKQQINSIYSQIGCNLPYFNNQDDNICKNVISGYGGFSPWITVFAILGLIVIMGIIGIILYVANKMGGEIQAGTTNILDGLTFKLIFLGVFVVSILLIFSIVVIANLCYIGP